MKRSVRILVLLYMQVLICHCQKNQSRQSDNVIDFCGQTDSYKSTTLPYSFANNAWGHDGSGFSCLRINNGGTSFEARYQWRDNYFSVHGYPHVKLEDSRLPVNVSQLYSLNFSAQWQTYVDGTKAMNSEAQAAALDEYRVRSDVAIDMFLDRTKDDSTGFRPAFEIMIWFWYCKDVTPVGDPSLDASGKQRQYKIEDTRFSLFEGVNAHGQAVFSWLPSTNVTSVDIDVSPLIHYLWYFELMSPDLFLGLIQFGSENFYAANKTFFAVQNYNISFTPLDLNPGGQPSKIPPLRLQNSASQFALEHWSGFWGTAWSAAGLSLFWNLDVHRHM